MPSADIILADDIVAELNDRTWTEALETERVYVPEWDSRSGEDHILRVGVLSGVDPSGEYFERIGDTLNNWPVILTFVKRLQEKRREEIDDLMDTVEEVRQFLCPQTFKVNGLTFEGIRFRYYARFNPESLSRNEEDDYVTYSGRFMSSFVVNYNGYPS